MASELAMILYAIAQADEEVNALERIDALLAQVRKLIRAFRKWECFYDGSSNSPDPCGCIACQAVRVSALLNPTTEDDDGK